MTTSTIDNGSSMSSAIVRMPMAVIFACGALLSLSALAVADRMSN